LRAALAWEATHSRLDPASLQPHPNRSARLYLLSEASISIFGAQNGNSELKEDWK